MHWMHWAMLWSILEIRRLGHGCENLPQGVRLSPAQLDSSITKEASIKAESLGDMSEAEARMADQWRSGIYKRTCWWRFHWVVSRSQFVKFTVHGISLHGCGWQHHGSSWWNSDFIFWRPCLEGFITFVSSAVSCFNSFGTRLHILDGDCESGEQHRRLKTK